MGSKTSHAGLPLNLRPYRACVGITLFNQNGKVFIGHRLGLSSKRGDSPWQMPQGGIETNEDHLIAARRELQEETGIVSSHFIATAEDWLTYNFPPDIADNVLGGRYKGQRQLWFAMLFTGEESEITVCQPDGEKVAPEFSHWRWQNLETLPALVVPFKQEIYTQLAIWFHDIPAKIRSGEFPTAA